MGLGRRRNRKRERRWERECPEQIRTGDRAAPTWEERESRRLRFADPRPNPILFLFLPLPPPFPRSDMPTSGSSSVEEKADASLRRDQITTPHWGMARRRRRGRTRASISRRRPP